MFNIAVNVQETRKRNRDNGLAGLVSYMEQGEICGLTGNNCLAATLKFLPLLGLGSGGAYVFCAGRGNGREHCLGKAGTLIEYPALFSGDTLRGNIRLFGAFSKSRPEKEVDELLTLLGLQTEADRPLSSLSDVMKRRAYLLIALLKEPPLIVLDKPQDYFGFDREKLKTVLSVAKQNSAVLITGEKEDIFGVCGQTFAVEHRKITQIYD